MNSIIPLASRFIAGNPTRTTSARKLHEFLGSGRDFPTWMRDRILQYGFADNQDYIVCSPKRGSKGRGGKNTKDYYLTLDMAKELAMVERTDKGREARRYFIECERQLLEKKQVPATHPRQRFLMVMENGQVTGMSPIPDNAYIVTPENLPEVIKEVLPGKVLVDLRDFNRAATKKVVADAAFRLDGVVADLREVLPEDAQCSVKKYLSDLENATTFLFAYSRG